MKISFIKKVSLGFVAGISVFCAGGALAEMVSLPVVQNPEIYIKNLVLDKTQYAAGDTVKGTFTAYNTRDTGAANVYYEIWLVGDYQKNGLASSFYDNNKIGPQYFAPKESKDASFSYKIPATIAGNNLGIQVRAVLGTDTLMSWVDAKIKVSGVMGLLQVTNAFVQSGDTKFYVQAGPTLKEDKTAFLGVDLKNTLTSSITFTPQIKIYNWGTQLLVKEEKLSAVTIAAGTSKQVKYDLPRFDNSGAVYVGEISFFDAAGSMKAQTIAFRYLVAGDLVVIHNFSIDKVKVKTGDTITATMQYTGASPDIELTVPTAPATSVYSLGVKLTSKTGETVANYSENFNFNTSTEKTFSIKSLADANGITADLTVKNGDKIVTQYKAVFPGVAEEKPVTTTSNNNLLYKIIGFAIIIILAIVALIFLIKKKKSAALVILLILVGSFFGVNAKASCVQMYYSVNNDMDGNGIPDPLQPSLSMSTSSPDAVNSCQEYSIQGSASAITCGNLNQKIKIFKKNANTINNSCTDDNWGDPIATINTAGYTCRGGGCTLQGGGQFSDGGHRETAIGAHSICVKAMAYQMRSNGEEQAWAATVIVRQDFTVYANAALTATCSAPPVSYINESMTWTANASGGNNVYRYAWSGDASGTASTSDNTYQAPGGTKNAQVVVTDTCGQSKTANCSTSLEYRAVTATCTVSPTPAYTNGNVKWEAHPLGGNGSYTYVWTGATTKTTNPANEIYTTPGQKNASVTVTSNDGQANNHATAICDTNVTNTPLTATCSASPLPAHVGEPVTWTVVPSGGDGEYTYKNVNNVIGWTGGTGVDSLSGTGLTIIKTYTTAGSKNASITVNSNGSSIVANCSATLTWPDLSASCSASPKPAYVDGVVTWTVSKSGGNNNYTYSNWSGADGLSGPGSEIDKTITKTYVTASPPLKDAHITVSSNGQSKTADCSVEVRPFGVYGMNNAESFCDSPGAYFVNFSWTYGSSIPEARYQFQVEDKDSVEANNGVFDISELAVNSDSGIKTFSSALNSIPITVAYGTTPGNLNYDTDYYWRVKVYDNQGHSTDWYYGGTAKTGPGDQFTTAVHAWPNPIYTVAPSSAPLVNSTVNVAFSDSSMCYKTGSSVPYRCSCLKEDGTPLSPACVDPQLGNAYLWSFGDTDSSTTKGNIDLHKYTEAKNFNTQLRVCDDIGCCTAKNNVTVLPAGSVPEWREISPF